MGTGDSWRRNGGRSSSLSSRYRLLHTAGAVEGGAGVAPRGETAGGAVRSAPGTVSFTLRGGVGTWGRGDSWRRNGGRSRSLSSRYSLLYTEGGLGHGGGEAPGGETVGGAVRSAPGTVSFTLGGGWGHGGGETPGGEIVGGAVRAAPGTVSFTLRGGSGGVDGRERGEGLLEEKQGEE